LTAAPDQIKEVLYIGRLKIIELQQSDLLTCARTSGRDAGQVSIHRGNSGRCSRSEQIEHAELLGHAEVAVYAANQKWSRKSRLQQLGRVPTTEGQVAFRVILRRQNYVGWPRMEGQSNIRQTDHGLHVSGDRRGQTRIAIV
jgi:hypothetical protein